MTISPSATTAGKGGEAGPRASGARPGGATLRQRKPGTAAKASSSRVTTSANNAGNMWRFYTEDSPGLKV